MVRGRNVDVDVHVAMQFVMELHFSVETHILLEEVIDLFCQVVDHFVFLFHESSKILVLSYELSVIFVLWKVN